MKLKAKSSSLINKSLIVDRGPYTSVLRTNPSIYFSDASPGDIFNFVQQLISCSKWDIRYKDNTPMLSLYRDHMFYINKDTDIEITKEKINNFNDAFIGNNSTIDIFKLLEDSIKLYINENNSVSTALVNIYKKSINRTSNDDYLFRNGIRKFSENHFAISSYNLIGHEISVSEDTPNTVSSFSDQEKSKILTVLPSKISKTSQSTNLKFKEKTYNSPDKNINGEEVSSTIRHYEFLTNMLIKELSYCYQGKIFIKYNDDIEIGDTITLLDETTTTFGIFEIDAFEHTFDERGLITVLFVKAKVNHVDPFLDLYNLKLGYNLINEFQEKVILENNSEVTLNFKLKNIFGFYLKTLLQSPKYLVPKYMESSGSAYELFNSDGKIYQFEYSSIQTPIRIFPVLKRGKMVYPSTLEFAFFNDDNSEIDSFITMFLNKIAISIKNGVFIGYNWTKSVLLFLADFTISNFTFGISDIIKPLLGFSESKALKQISSELFYTHPLYSNADKLYSATNEYNPYNGIYNVGNFDLKIGFFNIQAQTISNMFPSGANYTKDQIAENLVIKTSIIKKILSQSFNITAMVEAYDTFCLNENIDANSDLYNYNLDSFLESIKPENSNLYEKFNIMRNILKERASNEYGILNSDGKFNILDNKFIELENGRRAIETTIDISSLNINNISNLKIVWFHNVYKENNIDEKNVYQERRDNVNIILNKYKEYINDKTAVIIMADFNLNIFNYGEKPLESSSAYVNATMELPKNSQFKVMNKKATTVNKYGEVSGNPYDNILASDNISKYIKASRFVYPLDNIYHRKIVSDHIPVFIGINKIDK